MTNSPYGTRGSTVCYGDACVTSSQTQASEIGLGILKAGGNAADAAVAVAAALNVLSPCFTGIGGDCFCLYYDAASKRVRGLNGSGRSSSDINLDVVQQLGFSSTNPIPRTHGLNVTVPGAAAGWVDTVTEFGSGKLSMQQILQPAIDLAEGGFTVQPVAANGWQHDVDKLLRKSNPHAACLLKEGRAPKAGETMRLPLLAKTFKELALKGKAGFYEGRVAQAIVDIVKANGGTLNLQDLKMHSSSLVEPICINYKGLNVWEVPPSGQGITTLMGLNILEGLDLKAMGHNSVKYLHCLIEAIKLSFADSLWYCADSDKVDVPVNKLLSKDYAAKRRTLIDPVRASKDLKHGEVHSGGDTVYFCVVDEQGNACSFINSNYRHFGTGLVPEGCGFTLHNRGSNFSLQPGHPNVLAPGKRSYHTIIPSMVTAADTGSLLATFGVMASFMQPQGQIQVLLNMSEFSMDPQKALNQPRFRVEVVEQDGLTGKVFLEEGFSDDIIQELRTMGHNVVGPVKGWDRRIFGRGQVITVGDWYTARDSVGKSLYAGSDFRGDGSPVGY
ncbi:glutathione hydrolase-like YwrD proenzyme [Patiria miniata]|uniref:Gamma-glutamyltransferase n=1 Tax=Patiria miniata TaxID=46514 RepID=A0A914AJ66_PATMI|nr:glutathione hydrolase-like YwrD proenzyme [Patiria miniata]